MEFQTDSSKEERDPLDAKFDDLVNHALKEWKTPGLSVAVVNGDSTFTKVCRFILLNKTLTEP